MSLNFFDVNSYRSANPDLAAAGIITNAQLVSHFQNYGVNEGRYFSTFADLDFYRASNSDLSQLSNAQLVDHLQNYGVAEDRKFSPFFDLDFYRASNSDLSQLSNTQLVDHLQNYGLAEDRKFSPFFDLDFYLEANSDLAGFSYKEALQHLEIYGLNEGRVSSQFVSLNSYRTINQDLSNLSNVQALEHLELYGLKEGRQFSRIVDINYYRQVNPDLASFDSKQALQHLENYGLNEGREFSQVFSLNFYKSYYPDLVAARLNNNQLLKHFELHGLEEGRISYPGKNTYKAENGEILGNFSPSPSYDLVYRGGKTIANLNFVNIYLGGSQSWDNSDIQNIDWSLKEAMSDPRLNSIMSQYFPGQEITSNFLSSGVVEASVPDTVSQEFLETLISNVGDVGAFSGFDLSSTVFDFMLPSGTLLAQGDSDSLSGLGGYHGSVNFQGLYGEQNTAYYAIGVYSQDYPYLGLSNGISVFDQPWKNVVATTYHELNEARTDPDVGENNRTGMGLLGWYSDNGGEIGDYPLSESQNNGSINYVFGEVPLVNGNGTVPIQFQYSNAVHGPEDPTTILLS
ncbi:MAG: hypothetical protein V7K32_26255 [Nostoc sp.]|uniref:hypothetical protein n=1 Tax=Nostoc sp. TaxID=1180 RepID=UPI002FF836AC